MIPLTDRASLPDHGWRKNMLDRKRTVDYYDHKSNQRNYFIQAWREIFFWDEPQALGLNSVHALASNTIAKRYKLLKALFCRIYDVRAV